MSCNFPLDRVSGIRKVLQPEAIQVRRLFEPPTGPGRRQLAFAPCKLYDSRSLSATDVLIANEACRTLSEAFTMHPPIQYLVNFEEIHFVKLRNGTRKELGHGSFGRVYLAEYAGEKVAVKLIDYNILPKESRRTKDGSSVLGINVERVEAMLLKEASVQFLIRHEFVVAIHGVAIHRGDGTEDDPPEFAIVMQYIPGPNLTDWLAEDGKIASMQQRLSMLHQLASAVRFMHRKAILHGDLQSDNVLLDGDGRPRIADFGTAVQLNALGNTALHSTLRHARGSPLYMDPALSDGRTTFVPACDVYSFGILMWQVLTARLPFVGPISNEHAQEPAVEVHRKLVSAGQRPDLAALPADTPAAIRALMVSCWSGEPSARPSMATVEEDLQAGVAALRSQSLASNAPPATSAASGQQAVAESSTGRTPEPAIAAQLKAAALRAAQQVTSAVRSVQQNLLAVPDLWPGQEKSIAEPNPVTVGPLLHACINKKPSALILELLTTGADVNEADQVCASEPRPQTGGDVNLPCGCEPSAEVNAALTQCRHHVDNWITGYSPTPCRMSVSLPLFFNHPFLPFASESGCRMAEHRCTGLPSGGSLTCWRC